MGVVLWLQSLRGRLSLLAVAPAAVATVITAGVGLWSARANETEELDAAMRRAREQTTAFLRQSGERMHAAAAGAAIRPSLVHAVAEHDRAAIGAQLDLSFASVRTADPTLDVMEVTDQAGRVLYRAHNSGQFGDDKGGLPDVKAALGGHVMVGTSVSPTSGETAVGAVVPLRLDGKVVGTLRAAMRLEASAARALAGQIGGQVLLFGGEKLRAASVDGVAATRPAEGDDAVMPLGSAGEHLLRTVPIIDLVGRPAGYVVVGLPLAHWQAGERRTVMLSGATAVVVIVLAMLLGGFTARGIAAPLVAMAGSMRMLSEGRLDITLAGRPRRDEVGAMATALESFRQDAIQKRALEAAAAAERDLRERRATAMERHTGDFGQVIVGVTGMLEQSAATMRESAGAMGKAADRTRATAADTARETENVTQNLMTVASAVDEMSASVAEISRQVAQAAAIARETVTKADATDARMHALSDNANEIGEIVRLIGDVASRTNLLALNATIEAARAGDAGKGFAVVAGEVKQLAAQTARATEQISAQIETMRGSTVDAVRVMGGVKEAIARMDEVAATIAAAVEQQGAAIREINMQTQGVSAATGSVSAAVQELAALAEEAGAVGSQVLATAEGLGTEVVTLRGEVDGFLVALRSDVTERRKYERVPANGLRGALIVPGRGETNVLLDDVSLGGVALACGWDVPCGTTVQLRLDHAAEPLRARVVRCDGKVVALVFQPEARQMRVLEAMISGLRQAA